MATAKMHALAPHRRAFPAVGTRGRLVSQHSGYDKTEDLVDGHARPRCVAG